MHAAHTHHRQARTRRGAAVVEFALAAPVLLLMVFGIVEFGRMLMVRNALTNASREGCRRAVLATTLDRNEVDAVVHSYMDPVVSSADVRIDVSPGSFAAVASETQVTVDVSVNYADVSWLPVDSLVEGFELHATTTQRRE